MPKLEVQIGNLKFKNPVLVASGTFGYGLIMSDFFDISSLGGIITKSITLKPKIGNPPPRIAETACGLLNSIGLENGGVENFLVDILPKMKSIRTNIIASIAGSSVDEYAELTDYLEGKVDAIEVNISCPNVKQGGMSFGQDERSVEGITKAVKKKTSLPVIIKLTPNVTHIETFSKVCENSGADAISLVNTYKGLSIDIKNRRSRLGNFAGGLSGPAIKPLALYAVFQVSRNLNIPVIGCGGIMNSSDAIEFIMAGATFVEIGSAIFREPDAPLKVLAGLKTYVEKEKIATLNQIRGVVNDR